MNKNEKKRRLTPAEEKRLKRFEEICADMEQRGYTRVFLTAGIVKANLYVLLMTIPVFAAGMILFFLVNDGKNISFFNSISSYLFLLIGMIVLTAVHEGIHGLTWSIFAENHLRDIEFGFIKEYLTPYCTCGVPLKKSHYIIGTLMPLILTGIVPTAIAIAAGSFSLLVLGLIMILAAGGDVLIVIKLLRYRSSAEEIIYYDHPTELGGVVFER